MFKQNIVHILYTKISKEFPEDIYKKYLIFLPEVLQAQHFKYRRWQDRAANLFSKILLIKGLEKYGLNYSSLENLSHNNYGRPQIAETVDFNLSHSGDYVLCAISSGMRVGIDIEEIKPVDFSDFESLMDTEQWKSIKNADDPLRSFFKFWAIKESIIKADGRGMSIPLNDIILNDQAGYYETTWYLKELNLNEKYCSFLASSIENPVLIIEHIILNEHDSK